MSRKIRFTICHKEVLNFVFDLLYLLVIAHIFSNIWRFSGKLELNANSILLLNIVLSVWQREVTLFDIMSRSVGVNCFLKRQKLFCLFKLFYLYSFSITDLFWHIQHLASLINGNYLDLELVHVSRTSICHLNCQNFSEKL